MQNQGFGSIDDLIQKKPHPLIEKQEEEDGQPTSETLSETVQDKFDEKMEVIELQDLEEQTQSRANVYGMPYINLIEFPIGPDILGTLPESTARQYKALVFYKEDNQMRLGIVDPDQPNLPQLYRDLQREHPGVEMKNYLISQHSFDVALKLYKGVVKIRKVEYGVHITAGQLENYQQKLRTYTDLETQLQTANMTNAFAMIISMALNANSSDIHIEARKEDAIIRFRIDGVLTDVAKVEIARLASLVNRVKSIAELKLNINSIPQDGSISIEMDKGEALDIRVSTLPSAFGESIVMRLLKSSSVGLSLADLGMRETVYKRLKAEIEKPNGMIITTGPTGSGKTTTLYAILNTLNSPETKIITLENPIEYKLKGIVQSQIDHSQAYTFDRGLRSILRQDPDIVMVGEIRDEETAKTAVDASLTGHLLLSTIHTNDAAGAVPRLMGMGIQGIYLAPSLNAVIGQRLVRKLCDACKKPAPLSAEYATRAREWVAAIPENSGEQKPDVDAVTWYQIVGCEACGNSGYKGRTGIYEVFSMSAEIEKEIISGQVSEYEMKSILHDAGMLTMGQDGLLKAADGITTLDEVFRVAKA